MRFIDLFSGIGGFRKSLESFNQECVFSSDNDKYACETYKNNFNEFPFNDIKKIDSKSIPDFEILCAGFPCQPFSMAGYRKGFNDPRGTLFFDIYRILEEKKPKIFILENVKGLISQDNGNSFKYIIDSLASKVNGELFVSNSNLNLGYNLYWGVLNSLDFNIPQNRERVFIIGFKDHDIDFNFPKKEERKKTLSSLLDNEPTIKRISSLSRSYIDKYLRNRANFESIKDLEYLLAYEIRKSRVSFRFDNASPCLTTKMGTGGNNVPYLVNKDRFLTIKELLKIQGFPSNYKMSQSYTENLRQIGNSVSIPVVKKIFNNILESI